MKVCSLDLETSIGTTIHGSTSRDPVNDVYTQIYAPHPDRVEVQHCAEGFQRGLKPSAALEVANCDLIVGHNLGFDLSYIWHDHILHTYLRDGGQVWDTQVAEYILTGQQHKFSSLAELQLKYLGVVEKPSRIGLLYKKGIGADQIILARDRCPRLWRLYNDYCETDGATPLKIFKAQYARAIKENMLPAIKLYNDYLLCLINMECTGIKIDLIKCEQTLRDFNAQHIVLLQKLQHLVQDKWDSRLPEFNINSPDHKSAMLFGGVIKYKTKIETGAYKNGNTRTRVVDMGVEIDGFGVNPERSTPLKKDGLYATGDSLLKEIALETTDYKLKEYIELQKSAMMYKKAAKTYCQAFIDRNVDGVLYPNFNNTLTETGRLSSSEPNLQNVSKRNEFGKVLHSLFIAPAGWKCVSIDFAQLEIWVLAWLSNDQLLIKHLLGGVDLHIMRMQYYNQEKTYDELYQLCKVDNDEYWNKQRTAAKTVSYQMAYGAQPKKVSESTGLDIEVVQTIFDKEKETYKKSSTLAERVIESINNTAVLSRQINIPRVKQKGLRFYKGLELLPIFDKLGNVVYNGQEFRKVGYWTSPTGRKYHFNDTGRVTKAGLRRSFSFTQPKNYPMQGGGADIQAATTAALLKCLLEKDDKIKMINEIHDSKWFYVREDVLKPCLLYLKTIIEDVPKIFLERFGLTVPFKFPVDIEVGDDYGEMGKYEF